jgi:hypothetical protein
VAWSLVTVHQITGEIFFSLLQDYSDDERYTTPKRWYLSTRLRFVPAQKAIGLALPLLHSGNFMDRPCAINCPRHAGDWIAKQRGKYYFIT